MDSPTHKRFTIKQKQEEENKHVQIYEFIFYEMTR